MSVLEERRKERTKNGERFFLQPDRPRQLFKHWVKVPRCCWKQLPKKVYPPCTEKDVRLLVTAIECDLDFVRVPMVKSPKFGGVVDIRLLLVGLGSTVY